MGVFVFHDIYYGLIKVQSQVMFQVKVFFKGINTPLVVLEWISHRIILQFRWYTLYKESQGLLDLPSAFISRMICIQIQLRYIMFLLLQYYLIIFISLTLQTTHLKGGYLLFFYEKVGGSRQRWIMGGFRSWNITTFPIIGYYNNLM